MDNTLNGIPVRSPDGSEWPVVLFFPRGRVRCMAHQRMDEGPCNATVFRIEGPSGESYNICFDCLKQHFNVGGKSA